MWDRLSKPFTQLALKEFGIGKKEADKVTTREGPDDRIKKISIKTEISF